MTKEDPFLKHGFSIWKGQINHIHRARPVDISLNLTPRGIKSANLMNAETERNTVCYI